MPATRTHTHTICKCRRISPYLGLQGPEQNGEVVVGGDVLRLEPRRLLSGAPRWRATGWPGPVPSLRLTPPESTADTTAGFRPSRASSGTGERDLGRAAHVKRRTPTDGTRRGELTRLSRPSAYERRMCVRWYASYSCFTHPLHDRGYTVGFT